MKRLVVAALAGFIFAIGLAVAGMTDPAKVLGFLDVTGAWDPSLAFVMAGAIGVHFLVARWAKTAARPLLGDRFDVPAGEPVDRALIVGAALFGVGWGAAGYCPGPALVGVASFAPTSLIFAAAMLVGIVGYRLTASGRRAL